jgi:hypothetical protein
MLSGWNIYELITLLLYLSVSTSARCCPEQLVSLDNSARFLIQPFTQVLFVDIANLYAASELNIDLLRSAYFFDVWKMAEHVRASHFAHMSNALLYVFRLPPCRFEMKSTSYRSSFTCSLSAVSDTRASFHSGVPSSWQSSRRFSIQLCCFTPVLCFS